MSQEAIQKRVQSASPIALLERTEGGLPTITGYAAVFYDPTNPKDTQFQLWDNVYERIHPRAFDNALKRDDVRGLVNHDEDKLLGRTKSNTLRLSVDARGLKYEIDPPDTQFARDIVASIKRGDISGSSFRFRPLVSTYTEPTPNNKTELVIRIDVQLVDVGPVTMPAYTGTDAGLRSDGIDTERVKAEVASLSSRSLDMGAIAKLLTRDDLDDGPTILDAPDIRQEFDYDCGACAVAIVCRMLMIGPDSTQGLGMYRDALGTTEDEGTDADAIIQYLGSLGLTVVARNDLTTQSLADSIAAGTPVICCIQDWEDSPTEIPEEQAGHWVVVIGCDDDNVTLQDPWAGRVSMPTYDFLARWEDDSLTADYIHYGITATKVATTN